MSDRPSEQGDLLPLSMHDPKREAARAPAAAIERPRRRIHRAVSGVLERADLADSFDGRIPLDVVSAAMAVSDLQGNLLGLSPAAAALFVRAGLPTTRLPMPLPASLWSRLASTTPGSHTEWYPESATDICIGVTPHRMGPSQVLILMSEITDRQQELSSRLHKQRLELTGRLVAMIAHDLRVPLSTIVFNAEMAWGRELSLQEVEVLLRDVREAAGRMRASIDGLLDFARPGGSRCHDVALEPTLERLRSLLHPSLREGRHTLSVHVDGDANHVSTNALLLEQVLVNLVMNAVEAADAPTDISIEATLVPASAAPPDLRNISAQALVCVTVQDNGPGIPESVRDRVFEPFFTTKKQGTGLGLPMAREAMTTMGASLTLEPTRSGACFAIWLPAAINAVPSVDP